MIGSLVCVGIGAAVSVFYLINRVKCRFPLVVVLKTLASMCFIGAALWGAFFKGVECYRYALLILGGLVWGLIGDIYLDLKPAYVADDETHTYVGYVAFINGHLHFIAAMLLAFGKSVEVWQWLLAPAGGMLLAALVIFLGKPFGWEMGKYSAISFIYAFVLGSTLTLSLVLWISIGIANPALIALAAGMVLFTVSDVILSFIYFGAGKQTATNIILNFVTYYVAQCAIALSIVLL